MADELGMPQEQAQEPQEGVCDPEAVAMTLDMIEKGARELFLDGELEPPKIRIILDCIQEARRGCESGDQNACSVLEDLMRKLTKHR